MSDHEPQTDESKERVTCVWCRRSTWMRMPGRTYFAHKNADGETCHASGLTRSEATGFLARQITDLAFIELGGMARKAEAIVCSVEQDTASSNPFAATLTIKVRVPKAKAVALGVRLQGRRPP